MLKVNYKKCTGCAGCKNICPKDCIVLQEDDEGFCYPEIDMDKCMDCGLCEKVCPVDKEMNSRNQSTIPKAYAGYSKDEEIRAKSMTAGIAYLCGRYVIEQGGVVFGAVGDVLHKVEHKKAVTLDELSPMRGSKYLQSDIGYIYREVKAELLTGKEVLFTGTPCQVAGLYGYLGKEYENLYTLDLICHGVPSGMVLKKYIKDLEKEKGSKIIAFYRDKEMGWKPVCFSYVFADGTKISQKGHDNLYNRAFSTNLITRKSCQNCEYAKIPRLADVSVGDYLQGNKGSIHDKENKGLSLVTINSKKGYWLFDQINGEIFAEEYPLEEVVSESEHLAKPPKRNIYRRSYFYLIRKHSFLSVNRIMLPNGEVHKALRRMYGVLCYIYEFFKKDSLIK
ncbi:MAG: 4Fe-4S dicluster domain-containing protein [Lachnospiraceae bacterium]|nr:4Fe-4S dicluster domain-containing protein [Lachnospiraceae bacterium]